MSTTTALARRTPREPAGRVRARRDAAYVATVADAVAQCHVHAGGWRRRDLLRGRPNGVASLFALLRELRATGASPAELEGVLVAIYNAGRALNLEGVAPIANESLAEVLEQEQEAEGRENVATVQVLAHLTPGNLRQLRGHCIAEIEAQRHVVAVIDAHLVALEAGRLQ